VEFEHYRSNVWCSNIPLSALSFAIDRRSLPGNLYLVGSAIWSIFTARRYVKHGICRRRVSARFVLTIASRGPSAIAELVVNFGCPIRISGMAEARALKLCTKEDYIKSGQRDDKSPLKGAWFCSRDSFFVCTAVELERNLHCTR